MSDDPLKGAIMYILLNQQFMTHADIARQLKKDKAMVSGYLQAMVDYGDLDMKKVGNAKVYYINESPQSALNFQSDRPTI